MPIQGKIIYIEVKIGIISFFYLHVLWKTKQKAINIFHFLRHCLSFSLKSHKLPLFQRIYEYEHLKKTYFFQVKQRINK